MIHAIFIAAIVLILPIAYLFSDNEITPLNITYPNTTLWNISYSHYTQDTSDALMEFNGSQTWVKHYEIAVKCSIGWKVINGNDKSREDVLASLPEYYKVNC